MANQYNKTKTKTKTNQNGVTVEKFKDAKTKSYKRTRPEGSPKKRWEENALFILNPPLYYTYKLGERIKSKKEHTKSSGGKLRSCKCKKK